MTRRRSDRTGSSRGRPVTRTLSGLKISTLRKYARSENLEWHEGKPLFLHSSRCPSFCDFACNDAHGHGFKIAEDIANLGAWKPKGARQTERGSPSLSKCHNSDR